MTLTDDLVHLVSQMSESDVEVQDNAHLTLTMDEDDIDQFAADIDYECEITDRYSGLIQVTVYLH